MSADRTLCVVASAPAERRRIAGACRAYGDVTVTESSALSCLRIVEPVSTIVVMPRSDFEQTTGQDVLAVCGTVMTLVLVGGESGSDLYRAIDLAFERRLRTRDPAPGDRTAQPDPIHDDATFVLLLATPQFSIQELRALRLYTSGLRLADVAAEMGVKDTTEKEYIQRVRQKYQAVGRPVPTKVHLRINAEHDGLLD